MTSTDDQPLVIDASAALYVASAPDGFAVADLYTLVAPPLMWSESFSVIRETYWRGEISLTLATETRGRIVSCPVRAHIGTRNLLDAWGIAERLGWAKTYDAEYVALALRLNCPLLTTDTRLRRGAGHLVEIIGPADL